MYKKRHTYLEIALAGVHGAGLDDSTVCPEYKISIPDSRPEPYYGELKENGYFLDKRPSDKLTEESIIDGVCSGPMVDLTLPDNTISHLLKNHEPFNGAFDSLRSLTTVSLDIYVEYWRRLGARIGQRKGNCIHWKNGTKEQIRPFDRRYQDA